MTSPGRDHVMRYERDRQEIQAVKQRLWEQHLLRAEGVSLNDHYDSWRQVGDSWGKVRTAPRRMPTRKPK